MEVFVAVIKVFLVPEAGRIFTMRYLYFAAALLGLAQAQTLEEFITTERERAIQGVLANIGPNGTQCPGCFPGVVAASPSTQDPDCKVALTDER